MTITTITNGSGYQILTPRANVQTIIVEGIGQTGNTGPQGIPGISEEDMVYARRVDFITDGLVYRGEAVVGTLNSSAAWRIRRIIIESDDDITIEWANGNSDFVNVWDNRLNYNYS